ncbi:MAG: hypothetical protein JSR77_00225 [Planctomycetes bacterium]|nr:hypothetical protein [Planctomycetota bacterium]
MNRIVTLAAVCLTSLAAGLGAHLGPPMICVEIDAGNLPGMPADASAKPSPAKTVDATLAFLGKEPSILAHMEAIRRAAMIIGTGHENTRLIAGLSLRALDTDAPAQSPALFDLAYYIGCLNQYGADLGVDLSSVDGVRGYGLMKRALANATGDQVAAMHFGAALMTHPVMRSGMQNPEKPGMGTDIYDQHLRKAVQGAPSGSLLDKNLIAHFQRWGGSIEAVRTAAK